MVCRAKLLSARGFESFWVEELLTLLAASFACCIKLVQLGPSPPDSRATPPFLNHIINHKMVCGSFGVVMGMTLIGVPIVIYQWDNDTAPLGLDWPGRTYAGMCIASGGIGGLIMVPTRDNDDNDNSQNNNNNNNSNRHYHYHQRGRLGYRWVGGLLSGALTASLAYWASWRIGLEQEDVVDLPLILFCAVPGLILYSLVQQCSDRTFPNHPGRHNYHSVPDNNIVHGVGSGSGANNNNNSPRRSILRESRFATVHNPRRTPLTER